MPVLANDYDPEGGVLTVVAVTPFDGVDVAPGPQRPDRRRARRRRRSSPASRSATRSPTTPATSRAPSSTCASCRPTRSTGRRSPAPTSPAPAAACRCSSTPSPTTPTPTATSSPSRASAPSRRAGRRRVEAGAVVYTPSDTFVGTDRLTYALVDAGGEIAIGEVLDRRDAGWPAPTARRRRSTTRCRPSPAAPRSCSTCSPTTPTPTATAPRHDGRHAVEPAATAVADDGGGGRVHPAGRLADGRRLGRRRRVHVRRSTTGAAARRRRP